MMLGASTDEMITLNGLNIYYGKTTVQELLNNGYTIADLEQVIEEPAQATCDLVRDGEVVAHLGFYGIKEQLSLEQLSAIPIDIALPVRGHGARKNENKTGAQILFWRIKWTCIIHLVMAMLCLGILSIPGIESLSSIVIGRIPGKGVFTIGVGLIALFTVVSVVSPVILWGSDLVGEKGAVLKKILLVFAVLVNVCFTFAYVYLIGSLAIH